MAGRDAKVNPLEIPWQPFRESMRVPVTPSVLCLWWVPIRGSIEIFTGRVVYWPAADCAMVARKSGSMVRVSNGAFYAIVTDPKPLALDDAIECAAHVSDSNATAAPAPQPASLLAPAAAGSSAESLPYPPGLD